MGALMTNLRRFAAGFFLTTAMSGWAATGAYAQTVPGSIADPDLILDENGVDLISGKFYAPAASVNSGTLSYEAKWFGANDASLFNTRVVVSGTTVYVSIAGKTTKFNKVGSVYVVDGNKGETLARVPQNTGFVFRNKAGDAAYFEDDPANLSGNPVGTTSARATLLRFADPTSKSINFYYKTVLSGGVTYQRISAIDNATTYEGFDVIKPAYASNTATHADFRKLASVKAFYQGPAGSQQACFATDDSCPSVVSRESISIVSTTAGGVDTISMTDKGGLVTTIQKGANGVTAVRNPGDSADGISLTYNGSGEVATLTDYGRAYTYVFGTSGANRTATVTLTGGGSKYYVLDPARRILLSRRNEALETESYAYDTEDRVTQITRPEGNYVTFTYDARGNVTQTSRVAKSGSGDPTTSISLGFTSGCTNATPTCNQPNWSRDEKGTQTDYVNGSIVGQYYVDEVRYPAATAGGDRFFVQKKYATIVGRALDGSGFEEPTSVTSTELVQVMRQKAPLGNFSSPQWISESNYYFDDNFGEHEILPLNSLDTGPNGVGGSIYRYGSSNDFDSIGRLTSEMDPSFYTTDNHFYDSNNRIAGTVSPDYDGAGAMTYRAVRYTYNGRGLVEKVEVGTATAQTQAALTAMTVIRATENSYDANRRLEKSLVRAGGSIISVTQYSYNAQGLLECAAVRMNSAIFSALPTSACTLGTEGSAGPDRVSKNYYDIAGRLLRTESAYGTAYVGSEVTYTYNANGTVATLTDANGNRTTYEYDGHDRVKKVVFPHKTTPGVSDATDYEQFWYDLSGNVTQKRLRDGQSIYLTYDLLNRVTAVDLPSPDSDLSYTYDVEGRLKTATRGSVTNTISYDAFGRVTSDGNGIGATQFQYDNLNRVTRMTWPDGFYVTYNYHGAGPISTIKENGSTTIATYGYDSAGRRTSLTYGNGSAQAFGYDSASRLNSITHNLTGTVNDQTISLTFNPASQIASRTASNDSYAFNGHYNVDRNYSVNGLNQFTSAGSTSFGYDARGNLTTSGSSSYGYSSENFLISGPGSASLAYDGRGALYQTSKSGVTTRFLYAGMNLAAEYSATNVLQRRFIFGPGVDNPILWYEGSGTTTKRYLMADEQGSITTVSDGSAALYAINRYDEYGIPATSNVGRFQYTGQAWLPELGLYHYKARAYSPTLGRFLQTDPIGYGDGLNFYNYVDSDPVNSTDPSGTEQLDHPGAVVEGRSLFNCFKFGNSCYSTGRDIADELALDFAQRNQPKPPPAAAKQSKLDTKDHTKELLKRLAELRKQIQNCPGAAASPQCKPLWDEYQKVVDSPEITALRKDQMDMTWRYWGYAFGAEFGGLTMGPSAMLTAGGAAVWSETKKAVQDWFSGF